MRLILASASPRRADLLRAAGFSFDVCVADVDESVRPGETPRQYVCRLAGDKAARVLGMVLAQHQQASEPSRPPRTDRSAADVLIIGADTTVVLEGDILGKPVDDDEARRMLRRLSGRQHLVLTGVSMMSPTGQRTDVAETAVEFAPLSDEQIRWYVETGEGRDKAGAYGIQGRASRFIPRIDGSYTNVVGLPVALVHTLLGAFTFGQRHLASGG